jgi:hypothetical protein
MAAAPDGEMPKNIIVMIDDGMGFPQLTLGNLAKEYPGMQSGQRFLNNTEIFGSISESFLTNTKGLSMNVEQKTETAEVNLFVSPEGNDSWSGSLPEPNGNESDGPFATPERARQAIRDIRDRRGDTTTVHVHLRDGHYMLPEPLTFSPEDCGALKTDESNSWLQSEGSVAFTYWSAYKDENPVLSGGCRIRGFKKENVHGQTAWVADVSRLLNKQGGFRQLFVNGTRRRRPRLPESGYFYIDKLPPESENQEGHQAFHYKQGDLTKWKNLTDVELVVHQKWVESRTWIQSINETNRLVQLDRNTQKPLVEPEPGNAKNDGYVYFVENVFEAMNKPGQWYLDKAEGRLYYIPLPDENIETAEVIAPILDSILRLEGNADNGRFVERLHFDGLTFAHNECNLPEGIAGYKQAAHGVSGAVQLRAAADCSFQHCRFIHMGTYAIELQEESHDITIRGNLIQDLGGGGIKVWHGCHRNVIADNDIGDGGHIFHSGVGLLIGNSSGTMIVHNHIHDFYYSGISIGWKWNYDRNDAFGNVVEYNHVHDIGKETLSDMGGIYTLGVSTGTRIRFNVFHNICCRSYGGWGIYLDEASSHILVEGNLVYDCSNQGTFEHWGRGNVWRNNIFAFCGKSPTADRRTANSGVQDWDSGSSGIMFASEQNYHWIRTPEPNRTFERNIVVTDGLPMLLDKEDLLSRGDHHSDYNLFWNYRDEEPVIWDYQPVFCEGNPKPAQQFDLEGIRKLGYEMHSIVADPEFVDAEKRDFRLSESSPASEIGFVPIDYSDVGPRKDTPS